MGHAVLFNKHLQVLTFCGCARPKFKTELLPLGLISVSLMSMYSVCVSASTTIEHLEDLEQPELLGDLELVRWWRLRLEVCVCADVCVTVTGLLEEFSWV